jgi:hypothetical protein
MRWLATVGLLMLAAPASASGLDDGPWVSGGAHPEGNDTCHAYSVLDDRVLAFCNRRPLGIGMDGHYELGPDSFDGPWVEADIQPEDDGTCHAYDALGNRVLGFCMVRLVEVHGHYELGPASLGEPVLEHESHPDGDATCHAYAALGNRVLAFCLRDQP